MDFPLYFDTYTQILPPVRPYWSFDTNVPSFASLDASFLFHLLNFILSLVPFFLIIAFYNSLCRHKTCWVYINTYITTNEHPNTVTIGTYRIIYLYGLCFDADIQKKSDATSAWITYFKSKWEMLEIMKIPECWKSSRRRKNSKTIFVLTRSRLAPTKELSTATSGNN